jgi:ribosomal protein S18 acetylase RimI-like enzyme
VTVVVRPYAPSDEEGWLRCRALAFLHTDYFDDVVRTKPSFDGPAFELVAVDGSDVVGVLDASLEGALATIDTIAVHPDRARAGVGSDLLDALLDRLPNDVTTLDAWTREDEAANRWYVGHGFVETFRYLHVYADHDELVAAGARPIGALRPVTTFFHAPIEAESDVRSRFARVHVCRRYERTLPDVP